MAKSGVPTSKSPSRLIDARIKELGDWRGDMLRRIRAVIRKADPDVVETWKWHHEKLAKAAERAHWEDLEPARSYVHPELRTTRAT